jgi:hypothetical protein
MSFSIPENPALEGIISFLASRPHSWTEWRVDSLRTFDSQSKTLHQELVLEIKLDERKIRIHHEGLNPSPSRIVQDALAVGAQTQKPPEWLTKGLRKPWKSLPLPKLGELATGTEIAVLEKRQFSSPESVHLFIKFQ